MARRGKAAISTQVKNEGKEGREGEGEEAFIKECAVTYAS